MDTLADYVSKFYTAKEATGRSEWTLTSYHFHIDRFLVWCAAQEYTGADLFGVAGAEVIEEYQTHMRANANSPHTVHGTYRSLRTLYNWIFKRFVPDDFENPFAYLSEPKTPDLLPKAISYAQVCVLLNSIAPTKHYPEWVCTRDRLLVRMLFETGARAGEILSLALNDIDLERRRLRVMRWKIQKEDFIPFSRSMKIELTTWLAQRPACDHASLWPSVLPTGRQAGPPLAYDGLKEMLRRRCKVAKLPKFAPHAFRHGRGVHIVQRGGDISLVQKILGHQQLSTTTIYLRFDGDQLRGLYDRIFD